MRLLKIHRALCALLLCAGLAGAGATQAAPALWQLRNEFVDEFGTRAKLPHWAGPQTIVAMEYSACKFVCTINWRRLIDIQDEADRRQLPLRFLIISLDPANDSPAAWRDYRKLRGIQRSNWHFVTGNRLATNHVARVLGVKWWYFNDAIVHDFRVLRVNDRGDIQAVMERFDELASDFLAR